MKLKEMTKISGVALSVVAATFVSISAFGDSPLSVFYDFKDGDVGTEVSTVTDDSGTYIGTAYLADSNGQKPKFSDDGPGMVVTGGVLVCSAPHSIAFRYKDSNNRSGYVEIPGLASALAGRSAFTVEYFIKMVEGFNYSEGGSYARYSKTAFYLKSSSSGFKQIAPVTTGGTTGKDAQNLTLQQYSDGTSSTNCKFEHNLSDGNWYHVAIVFSETNPSTHEGTLAFYVNGAHIGDTEYVNTSGSDLMFRIGSGYKRLPDGDNKTGQESIHASMSCLRVSGAALSPSEFLSTDVTSYVSGLDTMAFYDFKDGNSGDAVARVVNGVDSSLFPGTAATIGGSVTFSDDCPATKIYGSSNAGDVLVENPQSVRFEAGKSDNGGKISLASLATSLSRLDAYTVEFFFKMDAYDNWRTMAAWKYGDEVAVKFNMTGTAGSYPNTHGTYNACATESLTNKNGTITTGASTQSTLSRTLGSEWHHFAVVYTRSDNSIWTYIDKQVSPNAAIVTNQYTAVQYPLVLGTSAFSQKEGQEVFGGYISCVRVTPRALSMSDFMTTSEKAVLPDTVFALSFDDGVANEPVYGAPGGTTGPGTTGVKTYPDGRPVRILYNLFAECTPRCERTSYSDRLVMWEGCRMWTNNLALHYPAGATVAGQGNAVYYGAIVATSLASSKADREHMNPASWTMEAFVKLEKYNLPNSPDATKKALIFGKAGNTAPANNNPVWYPRSSWMVSYTSEGRLQLEWTERPTADFTEYGEGTTDYYKSATTAVTSLTDLRWHHVALSYDASARQFILYVDRSVVLTQPLLNADESNALFDGNYPYCFGRFPTTSGFEGWMDEIRFSSKVLQPEEFEQFETRGLVISFR